jgi:hypothetical protein
VLYTDIYIYIYIYIYTYFILRGDQILIEEGKCRLRNVVRELQETYQQYKQIINEKKYKNMIFGNNKKAGSTVRR